MRGQLLLALLLVAASIFYAPVASHLVTMAGDDSFIHRRIAYNYLHFGKPWFNLDQRVMVTSSPLWTVLITATSAFGRVANPVPFLEWLFILLGASAAFLLLRDGAQTNTWLSRALPALGFLLVCMGDMRSAIDQMETPCAICLMLVGILGVFRKKSWGLAVLALACFARYECCLLFAATAILLTIRREWSKSAIVKCLCVWVLGVGWLLVEFHTIIPNTLVAKSHLYSLSWSACVDFTINSNYSFLTCLALGLIWWLNRSDRRQHVYPAAVLLIGFGILLNIAYLVRKTLIFPWYLPLILIPVSIGIIVMADTRTLRGAAPGAFFAFTLLAPFYRLDAVFVHEARHGIDHAYPNFEWSARVHEYERVGGALYSVCPSGTLMTSEIGGLGWGFRGEILDGAGLASPDAIKYHPMRVPQERSNGGTGEIPAGYVKERHPDLIVSYDSFGESAIPAARALGYIDYTYPLFLPQDLGTIKQALDSKAIHVMVAPDGRCSPPSVDQAVRAAVSR